MKPGRSANADSDPITSRSRNIAEPARHCTRLPRAISPKLASYASRRLRIGERWRAPGDPQSAILAHPSPTCSEAEGQYAEARRLYRKASATLDGCANAVGVSPDPWTRGRRQPWNEAYVTARMGDWVEAERLYRTSVDLWSKTLGADHPFVARGLDALAEVMTAQGQQVEAETMLERASARNQAAGSRARPILMWQRGSLISLARARAASGHVPLAVRHVEEAITIYGRGGRPQEPDYWMAAALILPGRSRVQSRRPGGQGTSTFLQRLQKALCDI